MSAERLLGFLQRERCRAAIRRRQLKARIQQLLESGNRLLEEARAARREAAEARLQRDAVTALHLAWVASVRRVDPVYADAAPALPPYQYNPIRDRGPEESLDHIDDR